MSAKKKTMAAPSLSRRRRAPLLVLPRTARANATPARDRGVGTAGAVTTNRSHGTARPACLPHANPRTAVSIEGTIDGLCSRTARRKSGMREGRGRVAPPRRIVSPCSAAGVRYGDRFRREGRGADHTQRTGSSGAGRFHPGNGRIVDSAIKATSRSHASSGPGTK
jgi:hypothetical protein